MKQLQCILLLEEALLVSFLVLERFMFHSNTNLVVPQVDRPCQIKYGNRKL